MNKAVLSSIFFVCLTVQTVSIFLITRYSRGVLKEKFSIPSSILLNEIIKLFVSLIGIFVTHKEKYFSHLKTLIMCSLVSSVPALIYFFQNILSQVALSNIHPGLYSILSQLKILSAALLSVIILGKKLTTTQWRALLALVVCVTIVESANRAASNSSNEKTEMGNYFLGIITAIIANSASGFSGVYMEKILKNKVSSGPKLNLWERNFQLSLYSILFAAINVFVVDFKSTFTLGPFHDFSWTAFLMVLDYSVGGILVALVMTYADVIVKGFAVSVAIVLTTLLSHFLFGSPINLEFALGAVGVLIAIANYNDETASYTFQSKIKDVIEKEKSENAEKVDTENDKKEK
ncbi:UDP-galactose/UDP-N-acetylglucosamine transporter, putative [Entamoeba invadens IP1]|uniref:UDP-galactose/UDP-N-acetylglucosamine transporter, putative n=1 Tax=Entamoeba invadens IP1 TaxID=370355 RepID=A0A0A1TZU2_ENTIV|nr:UDP-galactose/UDP-N-acetylglucosamine transporter, putative [Entamoeba invadens IP1]ELP87142.1 UDP-galactose/UDP-N-acetylglucosamine transporter, putative [Entamoeba invadens IP1]|eukprot:XP_004253913.1 UDP-galactose/UDP-N-acetylglucosamine transporter, putative [Entamoeba invadens IP1]